MSQKPNIHSYLVPVNLFQLEDFPLKWRVLMAMATASNAEGVAWTSAAKICILLGEVDAEGSPSSSGLKAVRASRQALTKSGILTYFTVSLDGEKQHRWRLNLGAFKPGLADLLSHKGTPVDRWAGAEATQLDSAEEPLKPSKSGKVEKPQNDKPKASKSAEEEEEVEEAEPPSADDIALRAAVLARARQEREEEARLEAEQVQLQAPDSKEKSVFSWDMLGL